MTETAEDRVSRYLDRAEELLHEAAMQPDSTKAVNLTSVAEQYLVAAGTVGEYLRA